MPWARLPRMCRALAVPGWAVCAGTVCPAALLGAVHAGAVCLAVPGTACVRAPRMYGHHASGCAALCVQVFSGQLCLDRLCVWAPCARLWLVARSGAVLRCSTQQGLARGHFLLQLPTWDALPELLLMLLLTNLLAAASAGSDLLWLFSSEEPGQGGVVPAPRGGTASHQHPPGTAIGTQHLCERCPVSVSTCCPQPAPWAGGWPGAARVPSRPALGSQDCIWGTGMVGLPDDEIPA